MNNKQKGAINTVVAELKTIKFDDESNFAIGVHRIGDAEYDRLLKEGGWQEEIYYKKPESNAAIDFRTLKKYTGNFTITLFNHPS